MAAREGSSCPENHAPVKHFRQMVCLDHPWNARFDNLLRLAADSTLPFYDLCCLTHMAAELAIAMTKKSRAPSRKLLYEIGILPDVAAGNTNTPIAVSSRVITATTAEATPIQ